MRYKYSMRPIAIIGSILLVLASATGGALADRLFVIRPLDYIARRTTSLPVPESGSATRVVQEQSAVIDIAEKVSPSVVTVSITKQQRVLRRRTPFLDPFDFFGLEEAPRSPSREIEADIGSGFVVTRDGLIVTNKHVVSDTEAEYSIITKDNQEYKVERIYRDPANDLAILKVNAQLPAAELGDSDQLKVGQFVVAIGTALGEFRHTVTTGVISGLGRGITAGNGFTFAERLDNVIQTDAAINPGNSGGPLLDSSGRVIGVNVAIAAGANNIGFAIPINVIKESLANFERTGKFSRPFLGVQYRIIPRETAILNDVPAGAYLVEIVENSPAAKAGLEEGDIITKFDGQDLTNTNDLNTLSVLISKKKVGDSVKVEYIRDGQRHEATITLEESGE